MFCFIKAINPLLTMMVNLPCLMVSCTSFLRPTCSYTECPLSFLTGSCPTERTIAGYSSCLYFDFTGLPIVQGTDIPWTHALHHSAGLCDDTVPILLPSLSGFFPEPCPVSESSATRQGSGMIDAVRISYAATVFFSGRLMSINIFLGSYIVPFFSIV